MTGMTGMTDMTDVQMAEDYVTKNASHILDTNNAFISSHEAFLAGLRAARTQWHDLRKDPKDLPISMEPASALGSRTVLDQNGEPCWYSYKYKQWKNDKKRTDGTYDCKVIAWCDIPKFKEEQDA